jgi:hypothetical protein
LNNICSDLDKKDALIQAQLNDSTQFISYEEEYKYENSSPQEVLACLKSPESQSRSISIIGANQMKKSIDFSNLLTAEVESILTIAGYSDKPIETIENYS